MSTKDKVLDLLESNKGAYFSGENLAIKLDVSRSAIWKAIKALQGEGYNIKAVTNKGYCLSIDNDILSSSGIKKYLSPENKDIEIEILKSVDSTNTYVKSLASTNIPDGYTVISSEQTNGLGRKGRSFFSPSKSGIYMSIFLKPQNYSAQKAVKITTMAAVAMCKAILEVSSKSPQIKWVNDIFIDNKKVCGILTQASFDLESSTIEYAVLGIGINIYNPQNGFPTEIKDVATSLFSSTQADLKNQLSAFFINHFMSIYKNECDSYIDDYRKYSLVIGKKIKIVTPNGNKNAVAKSIDNECRLHVIFDDGTEEILSSGEISIKL